MNEYGEKLKSLFQDIPEPQRTLANDAIDEYVFFIQKINELKQLPYIRISKRDKSIQELTPAAKLIKEYSQALDNKRKMLFAIIKNNAAADDDALLNLLSSFGEI